MSSLVALLCFVSMCAAAAQSPDIAPPQDRPPLLKCGKVRFVTESGQPVARQSIGLMWMAVDWDKAPGPDAVKIPIKARKELKTNADGEVSIPGVKGGPYLLELLVLINGQDVYAEGHFQSTAKPESCLQILEVRGKQVLAKTEYSKAK